MKYKVGDKVRVRKDLEVGEHYGKDYLFTDKMELFKGKELTITKINKYSYNDYYYKLDNINWSWAEEMLEPVEDIIEYKGKKYDVVNSTIADSGTFIIRNKKIIDADLTLDLKEHKEEILDEVEKEYLRNVIKYVIEPTHNKIEHIKKMDYYDNAYYIEIMVDNNEGLPLLSFKDKRMYKGMELDKEYTLEELGLN